MGITDAEIHGSASVSVPQQFRPREYNSIYAVQAGEKEVGRAFYKAGASEDGFYRAIAYTGKQGKPAWHLRFRTEEARLTYLTKWAEGLHAHDEARRKVAEERKAPHEMVPGDVLCAVWGWEQTNVDYYQVTRTSARCVWVRPIAGQRKPTGYMQGDCVPLAGHFTGEETRHTVSFGAVKIDYCRRAFRVQYKEVGGVRVYEVGHYTEWA